MPTEDTSAGNAGNTRKKETRHERFIRLAERRTNYIIEKVRILANLADPRAYEYMPEEVDEMFGAIERELKATKSAFSRTRTEANAFSFNRNRHRPD